MRKLTASFFMSLDGVVDAPQDWHFPYMGDFINETPKYVVSRTLESVSWRNSTVIHGDALAAIAGLKNGAGREISVTGSGTLVRSLLVAELVDELRLMVHPVVVGRGKHLFEEGEEPKGLALASSEQFASGVLSLTYTAGAR